MLTRPRAGLVGLASLLAILLPPPAAAWAQSSSVRVTPTIGALWVDHDGDAARRFAPDRLDVGPAVSYGVVAEWAFDRRWSAGVGVTYAAPSPEIVSDDPRLEPPADRVALDLDVWTLDARVVRRWPDLGPVVLRIEGGVGMIRTSAAGEGFVAPPCFSTGGLSCDIVFPWDGTETASLLHVGAGIEVPVGERWGGRVSIADRMQLCPRGEGENRGSDVAFFACGPTGDQSLLHHLGAFAGVSFRP